MAILVNGKPIKRYQSTICAVKGVWPVYDTHGGKAVSTFSSEQAAAEEALRLNAVSELENAEPEQTMERS